MSCLSVSLSTKSSLEKSVESAVNDWKDLYDIISSVQGGQSTTQPTNVLLIVGPKEETA
jgi:hypothetical protein